MTDAEVAVVEDGIRRYSGLSAFRVEVEKDSIVVYTLHHSDADSERFSSEWGGGNFPFPRDRMMNFMRRSASYSKMMRFILCDKERRKFSVQRWCFKGSINNWTWDLDGGDLETLVKKYVKHLGKESFYDLM